MRQKTRPSRRSRRPDEPVGAAGQDPAEWLLVNETGWGMPHYIIALLAGAVVAAKAVAFYLGRRAASSRRTGGPPES